MCHQTSMINLYIVELKQRYIVKNRFDDVPTYSLSNSQHVQIRLDFAGDNATDHPHSRLKRIPCSYSGLKNILIFADFFFIKNTQFFTEIADFELQ